jgi:RNA polymerase sigma factor (sigma-70 family)
MSCVNLIICDGSFPSTNTSDIRSVMDPDQAKNLVKEQTHLIRKWVCNRCGDDKHLIPLALLHVNRHLSEQDWQVIREYDGTQPFEEFIRALTQEALEAFSHGVWFGKCAKTINYWVTRYEVEDQNKRQDAEDYIKDKLAEDNFARFRSYKPENTAPFPTYISIIIRNLLIDYLRRKTLVTESLDNTERDKSFNGRDVAEETPDSCSQQHLEEIGQWFFADSAPQTNKESTAQSPDIPDVVRLSPKDRLFLRAIYKDNMSITKAGRLPGINMNRLQAYNYHRKLKKQIKQWLHIMGYKNLQSLLTSN